MLEITKTKEELDMAEKLVADAANLVECRKKFGAWHLLKFGDIITDETSHRLEGWEAAYNSHPRVSLEVCAEAIRNTSAAPPTRGYTPEEIAKIVLDAAGVSYDE